jgi:hypothetical protein
MAFRNTSLGKVATGAAQLTVSVTIFVGVSSTFGERSVNAHTHQQGDHSLLSQGSAPGTSKPC